MWSILGCNSDRDLAESEATFKDLFFLYFIIVLGRQSLIVNRYVNDLYNAEG